MPEYDAITPTQWVIALAMCLIAFSTMWWLFWRGGRSEAIERDEAGPTEIIQRAMYAALHWRPHILSSRDDEAVDSEASDTGDRHLSPEANHPIAMGNNRDNHKMTVNPIDAGTSNQQGNIIPSEAREMIRHQAKAEAIADLIKAGLVTNQAKAIETAYHCSRTSSSRPDTPYQKAKQLIEQLVNRRPVFYDDLRAKIDAEVEAEPNIQEPVSEPG